MKHLKLHVKLLKKKVSYLVSLLVLTFMALLN